MAPSYLTGLAILLAQIFPDVGVEAFNITINTIVTVGGSIIIIIRQLATGRANLFGGRPEGFTE